jgi:hypothetical protein
MLRGRSPRFVLPSALAGAGAALLLAPRVALAASFGDDGSFFFDPTAAFTLDFETASEGFTPTEDPGALQGAHVITLAAFQGVDLPLSLPPSRRSYRVSVWVRDHETTADLELSYGGDRVDEVVTLYPTGRVTSDDWIELAADHARVDGPRLVVATLGLFSAGGAVADAVEVVADGDEADFPSPPNASCKGVGDAGVCGPDQVCVWGECRNVGGWVPPIPEDRDQVAAYLRGRITLLFGPYLERTQDLPAALVALDRMRFAKDRWTYWNGFMTAVRKLHDGHTTTSGLADFVIRNPRPLSLCFLEGDADLSHDTAQKDPDYLDVLVSHTGPDHTLGLHAGDRLVHVDGQHPIAWARSLIDLNWGQPAISNHTTFAELASALRGLISRYAGTIGVIRCDAGQKSCGAVEEIAIAELPFDPPDTMVERVTCDNRPLRHLEGAPANHETGDTVHQGLVKESLPEEKIFGVEWESLYTTNGSDGVGAGLKSAVNSWVNQGARGVILDHRTGFGGTIAAPEILWNFAVPRRASDLYVDRTFGEEEQPDPAAAIALFQKAVQKGYVQYAGSNAPHTEVPVALLLTEDVSASDWLPLGMKGAPKVKLFGPFQTNGGFSTRYAFGYWLGMSYVMAVGDDIQPDGSTHNGRGVEPDVVVLPKQSDLLDGKDTVFEAALAWVRSDLGPVK